MSEFSDMADFAGRIAEMPLGLPETPCVIRAWHHASSLSARYYGLPVYLVGGALFDPDPRDIDLVVVMPVGLFCAMYDGTRDEFDKSVAYANPYPIWRRWARDCAKQSRQLTYSCQRAVDFKTQHEAHAARFEKRQRLRLDCVVLPEKKTVAIDVLPLLASREGGFPKGT